MKKIILSLILILCLTSVQVQKVHAEAFTLTVAGGSIATGGLAGASLSALLPPVTIIVFAGLIAAGLNVELTEASEAAGMSKTEFVKSKIQEFCDSTNKTVGKFCETIVTGANITKDGMITLTDQASAQIKQLGNWLFASDNVINNTPSLSGDKVTINGNDYPYSTNITFTYSNSYLKIRTSIPCAFVKYSDNKLLIFNKSDFNSYYYVGSNGDAIPNSAMSKGIINGYTYSEINGSNIRYGTSSLELTNVNMSVSSFLNSLDGTFDVPMDAPVTDNTFTGNADDWASGSQDLTASPGQTTVLNPGITMPGVESPDITTDVNSYLDAIGRILDGVQNPAVDAVDGATGLPISVSLPNVAVPELDKENDQDIPQDKTPVVNDQDPAEGDNAIEPLTMQLKGVFPFCIPFDVVDMIKLLKTDPVAPSYNVDWHIPIVNTDLEFTVDLSPWNSVAAILRKMELFAFVVGLAVATRSMFIRG